MIAPTFRANLRQIFRSLRRRSRPAHETGYLVIGVATTDSWAHSTFGRKIEKVVIMRDQGLPIAIVGEQHRVVQLRT